MNIAKSVKYGLVNKDIAAQDLAKSLGKTKQTVSQWMNNKAEPRMADVVKMANIFGVKVSEFIGWGE